MLKILVSVKLSTNQRDQFYVENKRGLAKKINIPEEIDFLCLHVELCEKKILFNFSREKSIW